MKKNTLHPLYLIVDSAEWIELLAPTGLKLIQLRMKNKTKEDIKAHIIKAKKICKKNNILLIINDFWQEAIDHGCDYVHLGQEDAQQTDFKALQRASINYGISTHDETEREKALSLDPNYIALGPIYPTLLKKMPWEPQGLEKITQWKKAIGNLPLIAIGGLTPERLKGVFKAGADSAAVITDIITHNTPEKRIKEWQRTLIKLNLIKHA